MTDAWGWLLNAGFVAHGAMVTSDPLDMEENERCKAKEAEKADAIGDGGEKDRR
jgi:hypothetical protein